MARSAGWARSWSWPAKPKILPGATLDDILHGRYEKTAPDFRLEEYGFFVPFRTRRHATIRTHSFAHRPAFYRYRVALARTGGLPGPLADYLHALVTNCPNHLFRETVFRASGGGRRGLGVDVPLTHVRDHGIIVLAGHSHACHEVRSRHENLQKYFLEHDSATIACEVPVRMESWEFADYARILGTREPLTGHIDVLRQEDDGLLGVWDYKPHAAAERHAHLQVFLYALMLSLRTGLPLSAFHGGYFDENDATSSARPRSHGRRSEQAGQSLCGLRGFDNHQSQGPDTIPSPELYPKYAHEKREANPWGLASLSAFGSKIRTRRLTS